MIVAFIPDAPASTDSPIAPFTALSPQPGNATNTCPRPPIPRDQVRHLLFGTPSSVRSAITHLHALGYADPNDWSRPMSTGRPNEVMAILTKRVSVV